MEIRGVLSDNITSQWIDLNIIVNRQVRKANAARKKSNE